MPDSILPSLTPTGAQASAPRRLTRSTLVLLIGLQLLLALTVAAGVWPPARTCGAWRWTTCSTTPRSRRAAWKTT